MRGRFSTFILLTGFLQLSCAPAPDPGALRVAAAAYPITPDLGETYSDLNGNNRWDEDEPFEDADNDGIFDALWMANDLRRPALSIHDPLYVSAVVFEKDGRRIGMIALDSFGHGFAELERIREHEDYAGLGLDLLIMGSSHTHEGPDTVGLYGPSRTESGVKPRYMEYIRNQAIEALISAVASLQPAVMESGMMRTGLDTYQVDQRDPIILDDRLAALRFRSIRSDRVIATVVNWASHPEQVINGTAVSADYVGAWRADQEVRHERTVTVFFQGPLGGQVGSNNIGFSHEGVAYDACGDCSFEKAGALGRILSELTEETLREAPRQANPSLSFAVESIRLPLENIGFQMAFQASLIDRDLIDAKGETLPHDFDATQIQPYLESEMVYLTIGDVSMLSVPGELHPELAVGGYDGSSTSGGAAGLWSDDNEGVEDLTLAPGPPYLRDLLDTRVTMILAVTQDFLGYIMPAFNFQTHPTNPYLDSHDWDHHYEETNSLGPQTALMVQEAAKRLVASQ